jgi:hypothetical protein
MSLQALREHARTGGDVGQGAPATAHDVAATCGPLLLAASTWPIDIALRSALTWPVLQHAAWTWRIAEPGDDPALTWALALQHRAELLGFVEVAQEATRLTLSEKVSASVAVPRVRSALFRDEAHIQDDGRMPPPALPIDDVIALALGRWPAAAIPGDLLIKGQLFVATTLAHLGGFPRRQIVDAVCELLDQVAPIAAATTRASGPCAR